MDVFTVGDAEGNIVRYAEVPWDSVKKARTDLDPETGEPMTLALHDGVVIRDDAEKDTDGNDRKPTFNPFYLDSKGELRRVKADVWVESRMFTVPFGPCCLTPEMKEALYPDRDDVIVCGGRCCRTRVVAKIDDQYNIMKHYRDGIREYMVPAMERTARQTGLFLTESLRQGPNSSCLFWHPEDGSCSIHSYALDNGKHPFDLKPVPCSMFPARVLSGRLDRSPRLYVELIDPSVIRAHNIECPIGQPGLRPAYMNMQNELDWHFGEGFHEVMTHTFTSFYEPMWAACGL